MGKKNSYKPNRVESVSSSNVKDSEMKNGNGSSVATVEESTSDKVVSEGLAAMGREMDTALANGSVTIEGGSDVTTDDDTPPEGITCKHCDAPMLKYGKCPSCGETSRTPRNKRGGVKKIGELDSLSGWKFKVDEPISVASFADECSGVSLLHSLFMVRIQLPSMITYYQRLADDLEVVGADGIEEYVERKRDLNKTGQALAKYGAPAVLNELNASCANKEELKAALAALLATM